MAASQVQVSKSNVWVSVGAVAALLTGTVAVVGFASALHANVGVVVRDLAEIKRSLRQHVDVRQSQAVSLQEVRTRETLLEARVENLEREVRALRER